MAAPAAPAAPATPAAEGAAGIRVHPLFTKGPDPKALRLAEEARQKQKAAQDKRAATLAKNRAALLKQQHQQPRL